jgi:hypothetical protein
MPLPRIAIVVNLPNYYYPENDARSEKGEDIEDNPVKIELIITRPRTPQHTT